MKIKTRLFLGVSLYLLICIVDYLFNDSIDWMENIIAAVIGMAIAYVVIEVLPDFKLKDKS